MDAVGVRSERRVMQRWRLALLKYAAVLRVSVANNLAYMMEVFFRALLLVVLVFILSQLWKTTFALHKEKILSGFSINTMIWYLIAAESIALSPSPGTSEFRRWQSHRTRLGT